MQLPEVAALSALRAWHEGMPSRESVARFLPTAREPGTSARRVIGDVRRRIAAFALSRQWQDLACHFVGFARKGPAAARAVIAAIDELWRAAMPERCSVTQSRPGCRRASPQHCRPPASRPSRS